MPNQIDQAADSRAKALSPVATTWFRREPGLATLFLGLVVMILALLLPQEQRTFAFYPALAIIAAGTLLILRHGPDRSKDASR